MGRGVHALGRASTPSRSRISKATNSSKGRRLPELGEAVSRQSKASGRTRRCMTRRPSSPFRESESKSSRERSESEIQKNLHKRQQIQDETKAKDSARDARLTRATKRGCGVRATRSARRGVCSACVGVKHYLLGGRDPPTGVERRVRWWFVRYGGRGGELGWYREQKLQRTPASI